MPGEAKEIPVLSFENKVNWEKWLEKNNLDQTGIWLKIAKKQSGIKSVDYAEALETALCYGWIDGQKKSFDEKYFLQKFTPRRDRSIWSKVNREKAELLISSGQMKEPGFIAIEKAKLKGLWDSAYDSQSKIAVPEDFKAELDKNKIAADFFATLNRSNRYAILFRLQTAKKAETRAKLLNKFLKMLENSETFH
jgi:uncharacterized protein YdeI (YjbR/CyaY-like superfamily)